MSSLAREHPEDYRYQSLEGQREVLVEARFENGNGVELGPPDKTNPLAIDAERAAEDLTDDFGTAIPPSWEDE